MPMIELADLRVRFGETEVVKGVSFTVARGESFGLVGESGSGKSTVLRAISGLNPEWTGSISIAGAALGRRRSRDFYRRVQMVFQDPYGSLHPRQTVDRALAEPLLVHGIGDIDARIGRGLAEVALPASARFRYPHQLSGGQRQRVGVARALAADPPVLLMDEPFGAVDPIERDRLQEELLALQARVHKTIVFVTHDIDEAVRLGDRIAVMRQGGYLEQYATPAELLARPATDFVADFVGSDRTVKLLAVTAIDTGVLEPLPAGDDAAALPAVPATATLRDALGAVLAAPDGRVRVGDAGVLTMDGVRRSLRSGSPAA